MIFVIAHWLLVSIIYISQPIWQRNIAQQCANKIQSNIHLQILCFPASHGPSENVEEDDMFSMFVGTRVGGHHEMAITEIAGEHLVV